MFKKNIVRLIRYHIALLGVLSFLVLFVTYVCDGGNMETPLPLIAIYIFFQALVYVPLILTIISINLLVLIVVNPQITDWKKQLVYTVLPVLILFSSAVLVKNITVMHYYDWVNLQLYLIISACIILLKYFIFNILYQLSYLQSFIVLIIWTTSNYFMLNRVSKKISGLRNNIYPGRKTALELKNTFTNDAIPNK